MGAVRIASDLTVTELDLPEAGVHSTIQTASERPTRLVKACTIDESSCTSTGVGHATRPAQNITAWALASAW
ncbi:hypothetical protein [Streptomyces sp. R17]|uniref:Uncharacterized protein n=1 Tax=Streptomyces sp. R17 TaxID=3238626 RepID=A0AB39NZ30_9ACTN